MDPNASLFSVLTPLIGVFDMPRALAFYRDILGFDVVSSSPVVQTPEGQFSHWVWLRLGCADLMLNTLYDSGERPDLKVAGRDDVHGDTWLYIACTDIDAAYEQLASRGLETDRPQIAPYGLRTFKVKDPDGYWVVFQETRQ